METKGAGTHGACVPASFVDGHEKACRHFLCHGTFAFPLSWDIYRQMPS